MSQKFSDLRPKRKFLVTKTTFRSRKMNFSPRRGSPPLPMFSNTPFRSARLLLSNVPFERIGFRAIFGIVSRFFLAHESDRKKKPGCWACNCWSIVCPIPKETCCLYKFCQTRCQEQSVFFIASTKVRKRTSPFQERSFFYCIFICPTLRLTTDGV